MNRDDWHLMQQSLSDRARLRDPVAYASAIEPPAVRYCLGHRLITPACLLALAALVFFY